MDLLFILIFAAVIFAACYVVDLLFKRTFRNKKQHQSGKAVHLMKRYGVFGILLVVLSIAAFFGWLNGMGWIMAAGGGLIGVVGVGLIIYYLTFGIYYDDDGFLLAAFGKKNQTYEYGDILGQKLYIASGNVIIELYFRDGNTVVLQSTMDGVYSFLDEAFFGWCRQTEHDPNNCAFHDPQNSRWFPEMEEQ